MGLVYRRVEWRDGPAPGELDREGGSIGRDETHHRQCRGRRVSKGHAGRRGKADRRGFVERSHEELKDAHAKLEKAQQELERALPFEKEVKEKNLLIGKLRHEAVILNDHLTKALRFLKKGKPEDNVDR